jgi:hypothetical protein
MEIVEILARHLAIGDWPVAVGCLRLAIGYSLPVW